MGGAASGKKQREVYVGNLTIGAVTDVMLRELFNGALAHLMPDPQLNPPVINVGMDPSGTAPCLTQSYVLARCHGHADGLSALHSVATVPCKVDHCQLLECLVRGC